MSICIISDHKTKFHYNPQHIDQVKPKSEGGGLQSPKPTPYIRPAVNVAIKTKSCSSYALLRENAPMQTPLPVQQNNI